MIDLSVPATLVDEQSQVKDTVTYLFLERLPQFIFLKKTVSIGDIFFHLLPFWFAT